MPGNPDALRELLAGNTHPAATHEFVGQNFVGHGSNGFSLTVGGALRGTFVGIG